MGVIGLGKAGGRWRRGSRTGASLLVCDLDPERCESFAARHGGEIAPSAEATMACPSTCSRPAQPAPSTRPRRLPRLRRDRRRGQQPLTDRGVARRPAERGILYVPDFLANCGGLIHVSAEWYGERGPREAELIACAMDRLDTAIETARLEGSTPIEWRSARRSSASPPRDRESRAREPAPAL